MQKIVLTFGAITGAVLFVVFLGGAKLAMSGEGTAQTSGVLGYLIMLVGLTVIFVGIKRYRDRELGGVIRFGRALMVGLGISLVASVTYLIFWEIYLGVTDYVFIGEYTASVIDGEKAEGISGEELAALEAQMDSLNQLYANPLYRLPMIFLEVFPFGFIVSLISAALLRNSKFLPASR